MKRASTTTLETGIKPSRRTLLAGLAATAGVAAAGSFVPVRFAIAQPAKVKLGIMLPFSGTYASLGKNIALAYLPWDYCQLGRKLNVEYFAEAYPVEVVAVGYKALYDPENLKPRS